MPEPQRSSVPTLGVDPPDGAKALQERRMILDRLLEDRSTLPPVNDTAFFLRPDFTSILGIG